MMADSASAFAAGLAAVALEMKPAQQHQRAMSRHSTATGMPESLSVQLAEDLDNDSDCDMEGAADWDLTGSLPDVERFQDRARLEYQFDEDMVYRPDLYADAFEVADGDLMLRDWEAEDLPEAHAADLDMNELTTGADDEVQPIAGMMSIDARKSSAVEKAPLFSVPKVPPSTAPRGYARKHQNVLVVTPPAKEASETLLPEPELAKVPQGSALAAVAALRPGGQSASGSDQAAQMQPVVPPAPAERPLKKRPCNNVGLRASGGHGDGASGKLT